MVRAEESETLVNRSSLLPIVSSDMKEQKLNILKIICVYPLLTDGFFHLV